MSCEKNRQGLHLFWLLLCIPVFILSLSYLFLAIEHGNYNILFVKVHESGKYTLLDTILYFDHFSREILICIVTAFSFSVSFYLHAPLDNLNTASLRKVMYLSLFCIFIFLVLTVSGAIHKKGVNSFLLDLFQYRTRDDTLAYGSHWHYHLLHIFFMAGIAMGTSLVYRGKTGIASSDMNRPGSTLIYTFVIVVSLFTLIFVPDLRPFTDTRYLAHEFREIVTHATISMPLIFASLICLERKYTVKRCQHKAVMTRLKAGVFSLIGASVIPIYIVLKLLGRDIMSEAQKNNGFLDLFASHYFEHTLDYIFLILLSFFFYSFFIYLSIKKTQ